MICAVPDALWAEYYRTRSIEARNALVEAYRPLVRVVVRQAFKHLPASIDRDDLQSYGCIGLMQAVERFDSTKGAAFETYAGHRIRGAFRDERRLVEWVPRTVREEGTPVTKMVSLDAEVGEGDATRLKAAVGADGRATLRDLHFHDAARRALLALAPKRRRIFEAYYLDGHLMPEVAEQVGLTTGRVSQIITEDLAYLTRALASRKDAYLW